MIRGRFFSVDKTVSSMQCAQKNCAYCIFLCMICGAISNRVVHGRFQRVPCLLYLRKVFVDGHDSSSVTISGMLNFAAVADYCVIVLMFVFDLRVFTT